MKKKASNSQQSALVLLSIEKINSPQKESIEGSSIYKILKAFGLQQYAKVNRNER